MKQALTATIIFNLYELALAIRRGRAGAAKASRSLTKVAGMPFAPIAQTARQALAGEPLQVLPAVM